jgi:predicted nucleic acid-binding protein
MRSILTGYLRDGSLNMQQVTRIIDAAESAMAGCEHAVPSAQVLEIARRSRLSAYDCEFVVLAQALSSPLVSADKAVLKAFPDLAQSMETFLAG